MNSYGANVYCSFAIRKLAELGELESSFKMHFAPFKLAPRLGQSIPTEYFVLANLKSKGAVIGHLAETPIVDTVVDADGHRYRYAGVAPRRTDGRFDVEALRPGEWIVEPGLLYALERKV